MRTLRIVVAYDGSGYYGFQKQKNVVAIQNVLEEFLSKVCGEKITTIGSGRTDTGVHALAQTVSFTTNGRIPCANIVKAAEKMLPQDITVIEAREAEDGFHARINAKWKRYFYRIVENDYRDPFLVKYAWQVKNRLDEQMMNKAAAFLLGTHDFSAFRSSGSVDTSPVKTIYEAVWQRKNNELTFAIAGDGFLYHMVRNIVWSLVQVGLHQRTPAEFQQELASARCMFVNAPAPPQGLYLEKVYYEDFAEIETVRLYLRKLRISDKMHLNKIFKNEKVMYAWEHTFDDEEIDQWLQQNLQQYEADGFSFFAVLEKSTGNFIGVAGPVMENINGDRLPGVAYIFNNKYWHQGYAKEAVQASIEYLAERGYKKIVASIRPENLASRKVAEILGMKIEGEFYKNYNGKLMQHLLYFYQTR